MVDLLIDEINRLAHVQFEEHQTMDTGFKCPQGVKRSIW